MLLYAKELSHRHRGAAATLLLLPEGQDWATYGTLHTAVQTEEPRQFRSHPSARPLEI